MYTEIAKFVSPLDPELVTESSTAPQHWTTVRTRTVIFIVPFAEERNCGTVNERERERERENARWNT